MTSLGKVTGETGWGWKDQLATRHKFFCFEFKQKTIEFSLLRKKRWKGSDFEWKKKRRREGHSKCQQAWNKPVPIMKYKTTFSPPMPIDKSTNEKLIKRYQKSSLIDQLHVICSPFSLQSAVSQLRMFRYVPIFIKQQGSQLARHPFIVNVTDPFFFLFLGNSCVEHVLLAPVAVFGCMLVRVTASGSHSLAFAKTKNSSFPNWNVEHQWLSERTTVFLREHVLFFVKRFISKNGINLV